MAAKEAYAAAGAAGNKEAYRKLAELALRHETAALLERGERDEAWVSETKELAQRIEELGREAAERGVPVEDLEDRVAAFGKAVDDALAGVRAQREAEKREALAWALEEKRADLERELKRYEKTIAEAEARMAECDDEVAKLTGGLSEEEIKEKVVEAVAKGILDGMDPEDVDGILLVKGPEVGLDFMAEKERLEMRKERLDEQVRGFRSKAAEVRARIRACEDELAAFTRSDGAAGNASHGVE